MNLIYANFVARKVTSNTIFDLSHPCNRDNCLHPYWLLRERLRTYGIELNTADINDGRRILFELHMDVQKAKSNAPRYVLLWETPQVYPLNRSEGELGSYKKLFTWDDRLVDGRRFIKMNMPNPHTNLPIVDWSSRDRFCCLIAGNKTLSTRDSRDLYPERVMTIRWFEEYAPEEFDLYGVDWNIPVVPPGLRGKMLRRLWKGISKLVDLRAFPSYRGSVAHKYEVLSHTRFAICYENVGDLPGYITEKIFDCFFAGCVPVYWGASNVTDYIPAGCFIDRRKFSGDEDMYTKLKSITEAEYKAYQQAIQTFLESNEAHVFYSEHFARSVSDFILADLRSGRGPVSVPSAVAL